MAVSLSIVIPSHNRADLLRRCLQSVVQHAPDGCEILVVDDASPGAIITKTARDFAGVQVLRRESQGGFCAAVNAGLRIVRGEIIELLNDDTEVSTDWAETALEWFRDTSIGAVAPLVLRPGEKPVIDSAGDGYYIGGIARKCGHAQLPDEETLRPRHVFGASGSSAFYRRELVLRLGAFPESFGAYFEDVDLAFRLHWAGYSVVFEPRSRVWHHVSASYGRPAGRLLQLQSRNEELVFWRNLPDRVLLRALPRHAAVLAAKAWRRWREGTLAPFLRGRWQALREAPAILRHRKWLKTVSDGSDAARWEMAECYWR